MWSGNLLNSNRNLFLYYQYHVPPWTQLAGPDGSVFKGVVAHINGYTKVPVATLRELLASRGGVIEAYNTSKCTHMICEALPYAKIRELRKVSMGVGVPGWNDAVLRRKTLG